MRIGVVCRFSGLVFALFSSLSLAGCSSGRAPLNVDLQAEKNPPRGYLVYCSRAPGLCGDQRNELVWLTKARWNELVRVNDAVNAQTLSETDEKAFGLVDYWTVAAGEGDCEDIALLKRERLMKLGWPKSALLLAVSDTKGRSAHGAPAGPERHVVLLAFTDQGTYVLDNLTADIVEWSKARYRFAAVESPGNPLAWKAVRGGGR
jgi:predicted transglutaminase-like cysteine proteinase